MFPTARNDAPYAYACARESTPGYACIEIQLRRLIKSGTGYLFSTDLTVRASVNGDWDYVYATKLAMREPGPCVEMPELEATMKVMTGIARKLKKMELELGYANDSNFPEFARRVLVASGIRTVFAERKFNQGPRDRDGLMLADGIFGLPQVDPRHGARFLDVIGDLVADTLAKRGKQKESA
jgi:hypothetical protein